MRLRACRSWERFFRGRFGATFRSGRRPVLVKRADAAQDEESRAEFGGDSRSLLYRLVTSRLEDSYLKR